MNYDIIGDIHGQADKLERLLQALGYRLHHGCYRHPARQAIFVGDLIDRGPSQWRTVTLVRAMVEAGVAECLLGNHEFNAIAWHTPDPATPGEFLRPHTPSNRHQHARFLEKFEDHPRHAEAIAWFKTLPLWLDKGDFRVVHACWNDAYMADLAGALGPNNTLTDDLVVTSSRKGHPHFAAVEALCKGLEVELPPGASYVDQDGKTRTATRIAWWSDSLTTYRAAALSTEGMLDRIPDLPLSPDPRVRPYAGPPVFVGHYWRTGTPTLLAPNIACVDYSAANGGALVAYRWDGEPVLDVRKFVAVP